MARKEMGKAEWEAGTMGQGQAHTQAQMGQVRGQGGRVAVW